MRLNLIQHGETYQVQTSKMKMKIEDDAVDAKGGTTLARHGRHGCRGRHRAYHPPTAFGRLQTTVWLCSPLSKTTHTGYAPRLKQLKSDPEIVLKALKEAPRFLYASADMKTNKEFVIKALREKFAALVDTPEKLWCDHRLCDVAGHDIAVVTSLGI